MATLVPFLRHATRTALAVADADLLDRFAAGRDEDAFAEIVRRHGPVVYRICRRLVGSAGADDAFQASFLVLATRLDAARAAGSLGGWLAGVAGRVARQMRRAAGRRARHETIAAGRRPVEAGDNPLDLADQFRVLDEELTRLPDRLRDPVVLCLLQGRTQDEAAAELGRDARTLRRRLERAKEVLRARLERRGVVPAVAGALIAGAGSVSASVPGHLSSRTICTVFDFLTSGVGSSSSAPVVLAKGVATTMFARKLMHLMAALAVGLVGFGVVLADDGPPMPPPVPGPQPVALPQPVLTDKDRADDAARLKAQAKGLAGIDAKGQRLIQIDAICMDVPAGFCVEAGLEEKQGSWLLSARETRMFNALIRAQKEKGAVDIITHPKMLVHDNQTGFAQIGQNVPYVASREVKAKDGKPAVEEKIEFQEVGVKLKVTPKINADGKSIELHLDATVSDASTVQVTHGDGTTTPGPAFTFQSIGISVLLPDPGSFVFRAGRTSKDLERIWVVTTHIVKGNAAITSGTKRPTAAKPPLPAPPALALPVPVVPASGAVPLKPVTPMILPNPPHP